jgi:hypothetical protein
VLRPRGRRVRHLEGEISRAMATGCLWCEEGAKNLLRLAWWWRRRDGSHCHRHMCTQHVSFGVPTGNSAAVNACCGVAMVGGGGGGGGRLGRVEWWCSEVRHYSTVHIILNPHRTSAKTYPQLMTQATCSATTTSLVSLVTMALPLPFRNKNNRRSWLPWAKKERTMNHDEATFWLSQFIGKNLRIHASDGRVFGGQMKCTDKVSWKESSENYSIA